jgi:DNA polymerase-3 subunit delta'
MNQQLLAPFPWQQQQWHFILKRAQQNKLPQALLLTGQAGLGKELFAQQIIKTLLCENGIAKQQPCNNCRSCNLINAQTHPDYYALHPEEAGKAIKIDVVRDLIARLQQSAQYHTYKIALISPADLLNKAAANALLKTLEEPTAKTLIILVTDQISSLSATIRSRCQMINFTTPNIDIAATWLSDHAPKNIDVRQILRLTENSPLRALELTEENNFAQQQTIIKELLALALHTTQPMKLITAWVKLPIENIIHEMKNLAFDLIRLKSGISQLRAMEHVTTLNKIAANVNQQKLFHYLDEVYRLQQQMLLTNLNQQLLLENLLYTWYEYTK